jgi:cob(I)alamin adenosyltransferase
MPLYTGTGDEGLTGLFDNQRVPKDDLRIESYGSVDELNAAIGLLRGESLPDSLDQRLEVIQNTLFELGADLASPGSDASLPAVQRGTKQLEEWIDESEAQLPRLKTFILPAGHRESALLHVLRTATRRAERRFWSLSHRDTVRPEAGIYLNRLSDLFFSWARLANQRNGHGDTAWVRQPG